MSKSIKLSPKYGLNPCIPVCFYCGKEKNEIACLGKIGKKDEDIEAPHSAVLDYEPCDECMKVMKNNLLVIGVKKKENDREVPIKANLIPTGSYCVITPDAAKRIFNLDDKTIEYGRILVDDVIVKNLISAQDGNSNE